MTSCGTAGKVVNMVNLLPNRDGSHSLAAAGQKGIPLPNELGCARLFRPVIVQRKRKFESPFSVAFNCGRLLGLAMHCTKRWMTGRRAQHTANFEQGRKRIGGEIAGAPWRSSPGFSVSDSKPRPLTGADCQIECWLIHSASHWRSLLGQQAIEC